MPLPVKNKLILVCAAASVCVYSVIASAADNLEEITIVGIREQRQSKGATGLNLSLFDTPQSVSVIGEDAVNSFGLDSANDLLRLATGVNVEAVETDRTYYNARGFDITSMQVDGVGIPFDGLVQGALDTAIYDKIEVIRGANGLITGIGNPSGTINYVRKRPTNDPMLRVELTAGSWDKRRLEVDASTPLTSTGSWAARGVVVTEDSKSWLNLYQNQRRVFYGVVDGQLSDHSTLTLGYTHQENNSDGVLWGALPLVYSDGSQGDFDVSTTTSMDWTYWNNRTDTVFVELGVALSPDWQWTTTFNHTDYDEPSELFYVYLSPGLDPDTGLGVQGWPGKFDSESTSKQWETKIAGSFEGWGQAHELVLGVSLADKKLRSRDWEALTGFASMPAFPGWKGNEVSRPDYADAVVAADAEVKLNRLYGALRLSLSDTVKLILGLNAVDYRNAGYSWGVSTDSEERANSPYYGITWALSPSLNAYASYSNIYQPQYELDENFRPLGSAKGKSYEAGLKKEWLDNTLLTSLAVFKAEQDNLAEFAGYSDGDNIDDTDTSDDFDWSLYRGISVRSRGFEVEVAGKPRDSVTIQAGYTYLQLEDPNGEDNRTFIPRKTFKLLASWEPAVVAGLELGVSARWQDAIYYETDWGTLRQSSYSVLGAYASYAFTDRLSVSLRANNIGDEKYLSSIQFDQSYYGAPRNYSASLVWKL